MYKQRWIVTIQNTGAKLHVAPRGNHYNTYRRGSCRKECSCSFCKTRLTNLVMVCSMSCQHMSNAEELLPKLLHAASWEACCFQKRAPKKCISMRRSTRADKVVESLKPGRNLVQENSSQATDSTSKRTGYAETLHCPLVKDRLLQGRAECHQCLPLVSGEVPGGGL